MVKSQGHREIKEAHVSQQTWDTEPIFKLGQRRRRWHNIKTTLDQCLTFAGILHAGPACKVRFKRRRLEGFFLIKYHLHHLHVAREKNKWDKSTLDKSLPRLKWLKLEEKCVLAILWLSVRCHPEGIYNDRRAALAENRCHPLDTNLTSSDDSSDNQWFRGSKATYTTWALYSFSLGQARTDVRKKRQETDMIIENEAIIPECVPHHSMWFHTILTYTEPYVEWEQHDVFVDNQAATCQSAVNYVQNMSREARDGIIIHTGTNHVINETVDGISRKLRRLERNLLWISLSM